jgi:hypothetical protein
MVDSISKTDQVLVLLNRLAHSGETASAAVTRPDAHDEASQTLGVRSVRSSDIAFSIGFAHEQTYPGAKGPSRRQSYHKRLSEIRRVSVAADKDSNDALEVVLGQQSEPFYPARRLRCESWLWMLPA